MQINFTQDSYLSIPCDVLILPHFEGKTMLNSFFSEIDEGLNHHISSIIKQIPDCAKFGHVLPIYTLGKITSKMVLLAGAGNAQEFTLDKIRSLSAIVMREINRLHYRSAAPLFSSFENINNDFTMEKILQVIIEGAILGTYKFNYYKTESKNIDSLTTLYFRYNDALQHENLLKHANKARIIANAVNSARNLVNHPPHYMTPSRMAQYAEQLAANYHFDSLILDQEQMKDEQMHALLAVAQGSNEPPKMIILTYTGDPDSQEFTALIGKGITFDSGGISIKPAEGMCEMKDDMAGGASVLGTMEAIGQLRPKTNIVAIIPCTENMPSGNALKPGDVISSQKGSTIEIISTDAEGRLILADAVNHAIKLGATRIIDLATLTGACITALGKAASGVLANNEIWWKMLEAASLSTGEKMWRLPLFEEYKEQITSDIADLKNTGGRPAGTITAGLFIAHFAADTPWIHIDIAGTANSDKESGYNVKGASGVGVRTLVELMQRMASNHAI